MAASADWRARVQQELRRHRPAQVVATVDDDVKTFKPSGGERGRWTRLLEALPAEWQRLELQDKEGSILWALDAPSDGIAAPMQAGKLGNVDQVAALLKLMLSAQDVALARQGETVAKLQAGYEKLAEVLTSRLTSLENMVSTCLQSVYDATLVAGEAHALLRQTANGEQGNPAMEQFAKLVGLKFGPAARPNGQRGKASTPPGPTPTE